VRERRKPGPKTTDPWKLHAANYVHRVVICTAAMAMNFTLCPGGRVDARDALRILQRQMLARSMTDCFPVIRSKGASVGKDARDRGGLFGCSMSNGIFTIF